MSKIKTKINIEGMSCVHCANKVKDSLENMTNVSSVKVNLKKKEAVIVSTSSLNMEEIKNTIEDLGYTLGENK